ncbi:MAG: hypothetical protein NVSMB33_04790 [Ktedonobacteraceae bacterium]
MAQQVSKPPGPQEQHEVQSPISQPLFHQPTRFAQAGIFALLALVSVFILSSAALLLYSLIQTTMPPLPMARMASSTPARQHAHTLLPTPASTPTMDATPPLFIPGNTVIPPLQLPAGHFIFYEQQNNIYEVASTGGLPQVVPTPGYIYNQAVHPVITPAGQLLYSGDGVWLTDVFGGNARQLAPLAPNEVITSMALSSDGTTIAWSTEPAAGNGLLDIYAGPLTAPVKVFEQSTASCPCFRIFAFSHATGTRGDTLLLLTDGQQSHESLQLGVWSLDLTEPLVATPQLLLDGDSPQGPLALAPYSNVLLYSSYEGSVPVPTDGSVPTDIATLNYANSLKVTTLSGQPLAFDTSQVILAGQRELGNSAAYHWVTTPVFTLDGHALIYVEFSSQTQDPYDRSSALFIAHVSGTGKHLQVDKPQLLATSDALLLELGTWFNDRILTFYGDGTLYALDIRSGAVTTVVQTGAYARVIADVGVGDV